MTYVRDNLPQPRDSLCCSGGHSASSVGGRLSHSSCDRGCTLRTGRRRRHHGAPDRPVVVRRLGQPFIIENRPGGGTNIGTEAVVTAPADGYTLLVANVANAVNASLFPS